MRKRQRRELKRTNIAAAELGISLGLVRKLLEKKQLTRWKLNSLTYVDLNELRALIRKVS